MLVFNEKHINSPYSVIWKSYEIYTGIYKHWGNKMFQRVVRNKRIIWLIRAHNSCSPQRAKPVTVYKRLPINASPYWPYNNRDRSWSVARIHENHSFTKITFNPFECICDLIRALRFSPVANKLSTCVKAYLARELHRSSPVLDFTCWTNLVML